MSNGQPEVGLGFRGDFPLARYGQFAARAEALGFDVISVFGDLLYYPPIGPLIEVARATSRIRLGAACWNPYTTHPYEIAGQLASLDDASGGRAYLGLARGAWLQSIGIRQDRPLTRLRETTAVVRALLSGDRAGYRGEIFSVPSGSGLRHPLPAATPRVLIGTWGRRTARLAARIADEVKVGGTANPDMVRTMRTWLDADQRATDRRVPVRIAVGAVTVVDEDAERARRTARTEVAMYLAVVGSLDPTVSLPEGFVATLAQRLHDGDPQGAGALIPDEVLDCFALAGSPNTVADRVERLVAAGAGRIEFGPPYGLGVERGLELLGTQVLPRIRALGKG